MVDPESNADKESEAILEETIKEKPLTFAQAIAALEKRLIIDALRASQGNQRRTARRLDISRWKLARRVKKYQLQHLKK